MAEEQPKDDDPQIVDFQLDVQDMAMEIAIAFFQARPREGVTDAEAFAGLHPDTREAILRAARAACSYAIDKLAEAMRESGGDVTVIEVVKPDAGGATKH